MQQTYSWEAGTGNNVICSTFMTNKWNGHIKEKKLSNLQEAKKESISHDEMILLPIRLNHLWDKSGSELATFGR